ncbi:MAG: hypothetical protein OXG25_02945 [Gammaproteobacteria bacterium]|nr:hypothetical protein [Gammaproteobacteria bacterium]
MVKAELMEGGRMPLYAGVALPAGGIAAVAIATAEDRQLVVQIFHGAGALVSGNDIIGILSDNDRDKHGTSWDANP